MVPKDPVMLLSYVNMQLRDHYSSLEDCCLSLDIVQQELETKLASINYFYDSKSNQFK